MVHAAQFLFTIAQFPLYPFLTRTRLWIPSLFRLHETIRHNTPILQHIPLRIILQRQQKHLAMNNSTANSHTFPLGKASDNDDVQSCLKLVICSWKLVRWDLCHSVLLTLQFHSELGGAIHSVQLQPQLQQFILMSLHFWSASATLCKKWKQSLLSVKHHYVQPRKAHLVTHTVHLNISATKWGKCRCFH